VISSSHLHNIQGFYNIQVFYINFSPTTHCFRRVSYDAARISYRPSRVCLSLWLPTHWFNLKNKNLAIANRSRVSCAHNSSRASPWPWNLR